MAPREMGDFIVQIADALSLDNPHVVGPDVGTAASLFAAALHPGRSRGLVVGTGGTAFPLQLGGVLKEWVYAQSLEPCRKIDGRRFVAAAMSTLERYRLTDTAPQDYLNPIKARDLRNRCDVQAYPVQLPILRDLLGTIGTPVQIINGARDPVVPPVNAEYLHERLPRSKLDFIDAGHFIWKDSADSYAKLVTSWWDGGYAKVNDKKPH
jgi:pimeloyl-ACP methyl ester carboxylesterase